MEKAMIEKLIDTAIKQLDFSYTPYSGFKVGAALLTKKGEIYTGCNIENSSFGATICAERTAAVKAVSEGHRRFTKIAIVSKAGGYTYPCGICRQFLSEFSDENMEFIFEGKDGTILTKSIKDILPYAFNGEWRNI